jgi:hypothetical protein
MYLHKLDPNKEKFNIDNWLNHYIYLIIPIY